jgi:hypothetical protein
MGKVAIGLVAGPASQKPIQPEPSSHRYMVLDKRTQDCLLSTVSISIAGRGSKTSGGTGMIPGYRALGLLSNQRDSTNYTEREAEVTVLFLQVVNPH